MTVPTRIRCEGSHQRGHALGGRAICVMCGRLVDAVCAMNGVAIAELHDRDDIITLERRDSDSDDSPQPLDTGMTPHGSFYLWKFVHNAIIHPLLAFPWEGPQWLLRAHDWTAIRCPGAG